MRQNMEEMQATQEEMKRKEEVMKTLLVEMESEETTLREKIERIKRMD